MCCKYNLVFEDQCYTFFELYRLSKMFKNYKMSHLPIFSSVNSVMSKKKPQYCKNKKQNNCQGDSKFSILSFKQLIFEHDRNAESSK